MLHLHINLWKLCERKKNVGERMVPATAMLMITGLDHRLTNSMTKGS